LRPHLASSRQKQELACDDGEFIPPVLAEKARLQPATAQGAAPWLKEELKCIDASRSGPCRFFFIMNKSASLRQDSMYYFSYIAKIQSFSRNTVGN
jgi:hypothetical protein